MFLARVCRQPAAAGFCGLGVEKAAIGWLVSLGFAFLPVGIRGAETEPSVQQSVPNGAVIQAEEPAEVAGKATKRALTPEQKRKMIVVTTMLIAAILAVLLGLILWIMWWSRRTHRLLREPLPATRRGDELWYLKAKSNPAPTIDGPTPEPPLVPPAM